MSDAGGEAIECPVDIPWGDRNQRFPTPDGLQPTLFEMVEG